MLAWGIQTGSFAALWAHFVLEILILFNLHIWRLILTKRVQWKKEFSHNWRGFSAWAFKLDHLKSLEPILFQKFFNFSTLILGGQFLLPQGANNGEGEFIQLQKRMRHGVLCTWGSQTGPIAAPEAHFGKTIFQLFHFHTGRPILITPEGQ